MVDDEPDGPVGDLLRFTLPGAVAGLSLHGLTLLIDGQRTFPVAVFAMVALSVGPLAFWLTTGRGTAAASARFATLLGGGAGALVLWSLLRFGHEPSAADRYPWALAAVAAFAIAFLAVPFRQVRLAGGRVADATFYPGLFAAAWNQTAAGLLGGAFALGTVLLVAAMVALFSVVGIDLDPIAFRPEVLLPVTGAAFASAIGIVRRRTTILNGTRTLLLTLLRVLLPLQLAVVAVFVGAVVALGIDEIETGISVTAILLLSVALSLSLCSAAVGDAPRLEPRAIATLACRALALLVLPLSLLAARTLWLRVDAYGWTHERVIAATIVVVAIVHGAGYAAAALSSSRFARVLQGTNVAGAAVAFALAVLSLTPVLDGHRIGAASQLARFSDPEASPSAAELGYLKFSSGRYGERALDALASSPRAAEPALAAALAELSLADELRELRRPFGEPSPDERRDRLRQRMDERVADGTLSVFVEGGGPDPESVDRVEASAAGDESLRVVEVLLGSTDFEGECLERALRCALLISSAPLNAEAERVALLAVDVPDGALELRWLRRRPGETRWIGIAPRDTRWATHDSLAVDAATRTRFLGALARGELATRPVERRAVVIGDRAFLPGEGAETDPVDIDTRTNGTAGR